MAGRQVFDAVPVPFWFKVALKMEYQLNNSKKPWSNYGRKSSGLLSGFPVLHLHAWWVCGLLPLVGARGQETCSGQRNKSRSGSVTSEYKLGGQVHRSACLSLFSTASSNASCSVSLGGWVRSPTNRAFQATHDGNVLWARNKPLLF